MMSKYLIFLFSIWISLVVMTSARFENEDFMYNDPNEVKTDTRRRKSQKDSDSIDVESNESKQNRDSLTDDDNDARRKHSRKNKHALRIKNEYNMAYSEAPEHGVTKINGLRIRGGNVSDTLNFPYMAAVILGGRLWCAGAIVDINWVVTAAHCLNYVLNVSPLKTLSKFVKVRVGSVRAHEGGVLVGVSGAVRHPKYEEEPVPHADVALLKLEGNLEFGPNVNLIKIYDGMKEPFAQSFITVSGWGVTKGSESAFRDTTPDLLYGRLKIRTRHYCEDAYQLVNGFQFTSDFFCASLRNGTRDACLFDAGAPAVQNNRLMGIMSFGPERCGHEFQPAVFIKAFYFRDFVSDTVHKYKSPIDLINAMAENDPSLAGAIEAGGLTTLGIGGDPRLIAKTNRIPGNPMNEIPQLHKDMYTIPDALHD